jgi:hypothetical protein
MFWNLQVSYYEGKTRQVTCPGCAAGKGKLIHTKTGRLIFGCFPCRAERIVFACSVASITQIRLQFRRLRVASVDSGSQGDREMPGHALNVTYWRRIEDRGSKGADARISTVEDAES